MGLYHRDSSKWLKSFDEQSLTLIKSANALSNHMWEHVADTDKKHDIDYKKLYLIVKKLQSYSNIEPFEVEVEKGNVTKCVVRTEYDEQRDISIVFRFGFIVTAWLNDKNDTHKTLIKNKYEK